MEKPLFVGSAVIILVVAGFVNGPAWGGEISLAKRLAHFSEITKSDSTLENLSEARAKLLELPAFSQLRIIDAANVRDGLEHECEMVLDAKRRKIQYFIFSTNRMVDQDHSEFYYFKLNPKGVLQRAVVGQGLYKEGKPVKNSGKIEVLSTDNPIVREKLQHELDFWLQGWYREKQDGVRH